MSTKPIPTLNIPAKMPLADGNPFTIIHPLMNLLGHKANATYPASHSISSTFSLNRAIRKQVELIHKRNLVNATSSEALKEVFGQLEGLVKRWGYRGGNEVADRAVLRMKLEELRAAVDALEGK